MSFRRARVGDLAVLVAGRWARMGWVSGWWRVPVGIHLWVVLAVMTLVLGIGTVGDADTTLLRSEGPVGL